jgi:hypothetical protein
MVAASGRPGDGQGADAWHCPDATPATLSAMHPVFAASLAAARSNLLPGVILWLLGAALVTAWFAVPAARPAFETVRGWQNAGGVWFAAAASALCGGLLPWLAMLGLRRIPAGQAGRHGVFLVLFWIYRGVEVYWFYQLQARLFGDGSDAATLAAKTAFDMLVYTAFWSIPTTAIVYRWFYDCDASWSRLRGALDRELFAVRIPALIVSAWMVWAPSVAVIYSFPPALQVPVFNVVLCFWVLMATVLAGRKAKC